MAIGKDDDYDAIAAARDRALSEAGGDVQRPTISTSGNDAWRQSHFPAANQFGPVGATAQGAYLGFNQLGQQVAQNQVPIGGYGLGALQNAGYNRAGNPFGSFGNNKAPPPTSRLPFVSGGYQYPSGTQLPAGFQENNAGGLTPRVNAPTPTRYSAQPFVEGGYNFPSGSQLPEGFQESGGGGLTRQVPQETAQSKISFLPPGFTTTTGSTGLPNSSPNDVQFLPPGFTSINATTGSNGQLQMQPQKKDQWGLGGWY